MPWFRSYNLRIDIWTKYKDSNFKKKWIFVFAFQMENGCMDRKGLNLDRVLGVSKNAPCRRVGRQYDM